MNRTEELVLVLAGGADVRAGTANLDAANAMAAAKAAFQLATALD